MENMKRKFPRGCFTKWRKTGSRVMPCAGFDYCKQWGLWPSKQGEKSIPKDVPKGHLAVYVGENGNYKRFVIKVALLKHPLFKALLDQAQDEYDFTADSRLCIPCPESVFLDVIRCAGSPLDQVLVSLFHNLHMKIFIPEAYPDANM